MSVPALGNAATCCSNAVVRSATHGVRFYVPPSAGVTSGYKLQATGSLPAVVFLQSSDPLVCRAPNRSGVDFTASFSLNSEFARSVTVQPRVRAGLEAFKGSRISRPSQE